MVKIHYNANFITINLYRSKYTSMRFAIKLSSIITYQFYPSELYIFDIWNDNLQSFNREKNEASVPVFYADWTSVPVPRTSSLRGLDVGFIPLLPIWRIMTNTLTNTMTNTYVVIFLSVSIFGRGYHSRYQNFEFTVLPLSSSTSERSIKLAFAHYSTL